MGGNPCDNSRSLTYLVNPVDGVYAVVRNNPLLTTVSFWFNEECKFETFPSLEDFPREIFSDNLLAVPALRVEATVIVDSLDLGRRSLVEL